MKPIATRAAFVLLLTAVLPGTPPAGTGRALASQNAVDDGPRAFLNRHCVACHNDTARIAGLSLEALDVHRAGQDAEIWEKILRKLRSGTMPPLGRPRPAAAETRPVVAWLETTLDQAALDHPNAGRPTAHRLNRTEYGNAIRDLLDLDVDVASTLPPDDAADGFDNIANVLSVSPLLLERYLSAARRVSRLAVGDTTNRTVVYPVSHNLAQDERISEDLPLGSRGGVAIRHYFPADGEYRVRIKLQRNFLDEIRGLNEPQQIDVRIDGKRVRLFSIGGEQPEAGKTGVAAVHLALSAYLVSADDGLEVQTAVTVGSHVVGVTFLDRFLESEGPAVPSLLSKSRLSFQGRTGDAGVGQVEIQGPETVTAPGESPSRRRIFTCRPTSAGDEAACARTILSTLARRAYRRPVTSDDLQSLLPFYEDGRRRGTFDTGIEAALLPMLVSPHFLMRVEREPDRVRSNVTYPLSDLEIASRLSFFLWSSIPDDELLDLAVARRLSRRDVLASQVRRILADARSKALVDNFAGQWLGLRELAAVTPNEDAFPEFDENLRQAFARETELLFGSVLQENRSAVDLLTADYTFVNERLARHYGILNVRGPNFRRVALDENSVRRGLLGKGSVLAVTAYATRTSPVLRGKWILDNILGAPPPPPPPNVPDLQVKNEKGRPLSMRQAMEQHRRNPVCASCHARMDPLGFALENFDAIGRWRSASESNEPIDASGALPDGTTFQGPVALRQALVAHREEFVEAMTEKLLVYALGRELQYSDYPAIRAIVREAGAGGYRIVALIQGIVQSVPFQMRQSTATN